MGLRARAERRMRSSAINFVFIQFQMNKKLRQFWSISVKIALSLLSPDINECAIGTHKCSAVAVCYNTKGSYTCTCKPGYYGDGRYCEPGEVFFVLSFVCFLVIFIFYCLVEICLELLLSSYRKTLLKVKCAVSNIGELKDLLEYFPRRHVLCLMISRSIAKKHGQHVLSR